MAKPKSVKMPMGPITMMRNQLQKPGGTKGFYESEKIISVVYGLDTEQVEGELDYTSASKDLDGNEDKYSDDYSFTDANIPLLFI